MKGMLPLANSRDGDGLKWEMAPLRKHITHTLQKSFRYFMFQNYTNKWGVYLR